MVMRDLRRHLITGRKVQAGLIGAYQRAARRALLLDYDGTLVPLVADPKQARPDAELMDLLRALSAATAMACKSVLHREPAPTKDCAASSMLPRQPRSVK